MTRPYEAVVRNCDNVAVYYQDGRPVFAPHALRKDPRLMTLQELIVNDTELPEAYKQSPFGRQFLDGKAEGKAEGEAAMLLRILELRGIGIDGRSRERILECGDERQIQQWAEVALTIDRIEELFVRAIR